MLIPDMVGDEDKEGQCVYNEIYVRKNRRVNEWEELVREHGWELAHEGGLRVRVVV